MMKIFFSIIFSGLLITGALLYNHQQAQAQLGGLSSVGYSLLPFGGPITAVNYCCNGIELVIGPPRSGNYIFTWGSAMYLFYQIYRPGPWTVGDASAGGACVHIAGGCETAHPTTGIIRQIGTSLE